MYVGARKDSSTSSCVQQLGRFLTNKLHECPSGLTLRVELSRNAVKFLTQAPKIFLLKAPEGRCECSPAIHGGVPDVLPRLSPGGTAELFGGSFIRPYGTNQCNLTLQPQR